MVVDELVRFEDLTEETITWTRPNYFAFRYELVCSSGVLARLSVLGIGAERYVRTETAEASWRFDMFPLDRGDVPVSREGQEGRIAIYHRRDPPKWNFRMVRRSGFAWRRR